MFFHPLFRRRSNGLGLSQYPVGLLDFLTECRVIGMRIFISLRAFFKLPKETSFAPSSSEYFTAFSRTIFAFRKGTP